MQYGFGSRPQKSPKIAKIGITQSRFAQSFYRYGIFWMIPGESSCPDGSEHVWQRGVESLQGQVTAARSGPLFRAKKKNLKRCLPKPFGHNLHISALKLNQRYFDIYEISLIQFQG